MDKGKIGKRIADLNQLKSLFWDCDVSQIDIDQHRFYILERILELGNKKEIEWMRQHYTIDAIKEILIKSRDITPKNCQFWKELLKINEPPKPEPMIFVSDSNRKDHRVENLNEFKSIFGESDVSAVDIDKYKNYIIETILELGDKLEITWMIKKYAMDEIKEVLYNMPRHFPNEFSIEK